MVSIPVPVQRGARCAGSILSLLPRVGHLLLTLKRRYRTEQDEHFVIVVVVQAIYVVLFSGWMVYNHAWPAPDIIAMFLLGLAFLLARGFAFLRDWSPFMLLLLGYVGLTGLANGLIARAHVQFPINADHFLFFGHLPTLTLQAHLWDPHHLHWWDYMASILYPLHFVVPLVLGFAFWLWNRRYYWRFVASYLLLCYAGFVTYVVYPMAPPWWAANLHRIPAVQPIITQVRFGGVPNPIVTLTNVFKPNPVAAMPSIHAAFPVLVWLVLWRVWPKWGWAMVIYPLAMTFSVIYLGEHYVIDCIAGWLYAAAAFVLVWGDFAWLRRLNGRTQPSQRSPVLIPVRSEESPVLPRR